MSEYCTNCGAAISPAGGFCPACGAPVAAEAAVPQAVPGPAPVMYAQPVPAQPVYVAPEKKMNLALKIVLIVIAVAVTGFVLLMCIGFWAMKHPDALQKAGVPAVASPAGTVTTGASSPDLGVPQYPGSALDPNQSSTIDSGSTVVVQATYWTTDPVTAVANFYQSKVGDKASVVGLGDETIISIGRQGDSLTIMVDSEGGKTKMNFIHTKSK